MQLNFLLFWKDNFGGEADHFFSFQAFSPRPWDPYLSIVPPLESCPNVFPFRLSHSLKSQPHTSHHLLLDNLDPNNTRPIITYFIKYFLSPSVSTSFTIGLLFMSSMQCSQNLPIFPSWIHEYPFLSLYWSFYHPHLRHSW